MAKTEKLINNFERKKAVIYARYSSDNQREESIEGQIRECKEYAEKNKIIIIDTYIDRAMTAKSDNRPEFQRMIRDSAKQIFNTVLVWQLDRFSRDRYDSAHYKRILKKNNVKVISAKENIAEGASGILLESVLEGYAEYYSAELSEKIKRGMKENAIKGKIIGGTIPFGYYVDNEKRLQIEPTQAPIVVEVFNLYANETPMKDISKMLIERGIKANNSDTFTHRAVNRMLSNKKYIGEYSSCGIDISIPAIVDIELFEKVQRMLDKKKHAPAHCKPENEYCLTTKMYCSKCGSLLVGMSATSKTGAIHRYYICSNARKRKCSSKAIKKAVIEKIVFDELIKFLSNDNIVDNLINMLIEVQTQVSTKIPYLQEQLAEVEKRITNLISAVEQGFCSSSTKTRLLELEDTKSNLEASIMQEQIKKPVLTKQQIAYGIYRFYNLNLSNQDEKEILISKFINNITIYEDRLVIVCNYKEHTSIIPLEDINALYYNNKESSSIKTLTAPLKNPTLFHREWIVWFNY